MSGSPAVWPRIAHVSPSFSLTEYRTRIRARLSILGSRMGMRTPTRGSLRPLLPRARRQRHQKRVHPGVIGQLGVKCTEHDPALADGDGVAFHAREHFHVVPMTPDARRADEDGSQGVWSEAIDLEFDLEARDLPSERVPSRRRVDQAEVL